MPLLNLTGRHRPFSAVANAPHLQKAPVGMAIIVKTLEHQQQYLDDTAMLIGGLRFEGSSCVPLEQRLMDPQS